MAVAQFAILAIDKTRAAFASVNRNLAGISKSTDRFQKQIIGGFVGASIFAALAREIKEVASGIENIPGIPPQTVQSIVEMNSLMTEARTVLRGWVAEALAGFASVAKSIGMFLGAIEWKKLLNPLTSVQAVKEAMVKVQEALDAEMQQHIGTLREQSAAERQLAIDTKRTKDELEAKNNALKEYEKMARKAMAAQEHFATAQRDYTKSLQDEAEAVRKAVRTPMEEYGEAVDRLRFLHNNAGLSVEAFNRAVAKAHEKAFGQPVIEQAKETTKELSLAMQAVQNQMAQMWNSVSDRAGQAFADILIDGENAFKGLVNIVARSVVEMVARMAIINPILNSIMGGLGGGGGALPALFSLGKLFTGGGGGIDMDASGAMGGGFGGMAAGGPISAGATHLVGENGPELFTPSQAGRIIPNHNLAAGAGGGDAFSFTYNIASGVTRQELAPMLREHRRDIVARIANANARGKSMMMAAA